jgi:hypothetical protein
MDWTAESILEASDEEILAEADHSFKESSESFAIRMRDWVLRTFGRRPDPTPPPSPFAPAPGMRPARFEVLDVDTSKLRKRAA